MSVVVVVVYPWNLSSFFPLTNSISSVTLACDEGDGPIPPGLEDLLLKGGNEERHEKGGRTDGRTDGQSALRKGVVD